jgi:hypothetical protein
MMEAEILVAVIVILAVLLGIALWLLYRNQNPVQFSRRRWSRYVRDLVAHQARVDATRDESRPYVDSTVETRLRDFRHAVLSSAEVSAYLQRDRSRWLRCCAAMDCAEDAELGIKRYAALPRFSGFDGGYLFVYGLMQCLYVQQDALRVLHECVRGIVGPANVPARPFNWQDYPRLARVRKIRNEAFGHPAAGDQEQTVHFVTRGELSNSSFHYGSSSLKDEEGRDEWRHVRIDEVLADQEYDLLRALADMIARMQHAQHARRERLQCSAAKLVAAFGEDLLVRCDRLGEAMDVNRAEASQIVREVAEALRVYTDAFRECRAHVNDYAGIGSEVASLRSNLGLLREVLQAPGAEATDTKKICREVNASCWHLREWADELCDEDEDDEHYLATAPEIETSAPDVLDSKR